jgi:hypothetical protein
VCESGRPGVDKKTKLILDELLSQEKSFGKKAHELQAIEREFLPLCLDMNMLRRLLLVMAHLVCVTPLPGTRGDWTE